jgi:O-Antigen ligase
VRPERARRAAVVSAGAALLAGPTALAFFSGGYFQGPRVWAGAGAWACVAVALLAGARLPRGRDALLAIGGLGLLAAWTLVSILWAPLAGNAYGAGQIAMLYLGALLASAMVLRGRVLPLVEPALAAGTVVVVCYGLAGRLLPGLLHLARSVSAEGRLEQPLTYWNAMGELAALGFVLCARLAGDRTRPSWLRSLAAAATAPLGLGLYISFSRGALFACVAGLLTLVVLAPRRQQLAVVLLAVGVGVVASLAVAAFKGVTSLSGGLSTRESQGAIVLAVVIVLAAGAAVIAWLLAARVDDRALALPRRAPLIVTGLIAVGLTLAIVVGADESSGTSATLSGGATRLTSLQSNRYDYWSVALRAFGTEPLHGVGAGGWSVYWLRWRSVTEGAQDAHSLELQTLAELGVVGAVLLLGALAGIGLAARRALRSPLAPAVAGPIAALVTYLAHSPLDWDWQMPAVTLIAVTLAGVVLAAAPDPELPQSASAMRGASRRKIHTANAHTAA